MRNIRKKGDILPNGDILQSCGLRECVNKAAAISGWENKNGKPGKSNKGMGIGIAAMFNGSVTTYPFGSVALVKVNDSGITLYTGATEFGQGSDTALCQIAAEELGASLNDITLVSADSELCPPDIGNFISAGIHVTGEAVRRAAVDARNQILENASRLLETPVKQLQVKNLGIYSKASQEKALSFSDIIRLSQMENGAILGKGHAKAVADLKLGDASYSKAKPFTNAYSFVAAVAELEVEKETGKVGSIKLTIADDSGYPINPMNVEGQMEGQGSMGQGDSLLEEVTALEGVITNTSFLDYLLPGAMDQVQVKNVHVEDPDPQGPFGAKESGEGARAAVIAAIVNAIHDATGVTVKELPITPDKIKKALESKG